MSSTERVAVALSGGVDSAVAAARLQAQGYEVFGVTMRLWDGSVADSGADGNRACCGSRDLEDARRVADCLDIPFTVIDLEAAFRHHVVDDFIDRYQEGETPNPCIRCNQFLKFTILLERVQSLGATALATGHYAILERTGREIPRLLRGVDPRKDQSYFLFTLTANQMRRLHFPVGELTKDETRRLAARLALPVAEKRESQDLCFVPGGDYADFFARHQPHAMRPGPIEELSGRRLGQHRGIGLYTIGQRRGLGIASPHPLYVVAIDPIGNRLIVGPEEALQGESLELEGVNWIDDTPLVAPIRIEARVRYASPAVPAWVEPGAEGCARVRFEKRERAITPGQACVFYRERRMLGGGWIRRWHPSPILPG
ncbi:MAG: tRNA 2-thiouridine(34) synthase MnmA [Magnetococcales bacterium]|nr:tRNA 2-thiouridine(34) synthase MnmA [Magnetococcales bacterium]MBF0155848.1 tRNA 2-thiouridine(34) synthase MnmA [Magnetococcales bacterium]